MSVLIPDSAVQAVTETTREFSLLWSIIVPGGILLFSVIATLLLYRHFTGKSRDGS
jgi:hypothetical protein